MNYENHKIHHLADEFVDAIKQEGVNVFVYAMSFCSCKNQLLFTLCDRDKKEAIYKFELWENEEHDILINHALFVDLYSEANVQENLLFEQACVETGSVIKSIHTEREMLVQSSIHAISTAVKDGLEAVGFHGRVDTAFFDERGVCKIGFDTRNESGEIHLIDVRPDDSFFGQFFTTGETEPKFTIEADNLSEFVEKLENINA